MCASGVSCTWNAMRPFMPGKVAYAGTMLSTTAHEEIAINNIVRNFMIPFLVDPSLSRSLNDFAVEIAGRAVLKDLGHCASQFPRIRFPLLSVAWQTVEPSNSMKLVLAHSSILPGVIAACPAGHWEGSLLNTLDWQVGLGPDSI